MRTGRSTIARVATASLVIMALAFTSAQAGKPPKDDPQGDIPVCVTVKPTLLDGSPTAVRPDQEEGVYCHLGRKEGVLMGIWGDSGRFDMVTNKKGQEGGRTMVFDFPEAEEGEPFEGPTLPPWPAGMYMPLSVSIVTATESVGDAYYEHLLLMNTTDDPAPIRLCVRLTIPELSDGWFDLNYGDVLFEPGRDNMDRAYAVNVKCWNDGTDPENPGPREWEIWSVPPHLAYLNEYSGPDWTRKAVGLYQMPIRLIIQEMIE